LHLQINKIGEKIEKKMGYGAVFRVHCTFPYIQGKAVLNVKITIKIRRKIEMVGNDVG